MAERFLAQSNRSRVLVAVARPGGRNLWRMALLIGALVLCCWFSVARVAHAGGNATVSPDGGNMQTQFVFSVTGLTPGHGVDIVLYDAAEQRYTYQKDGVDQAIVVDDGGAAAITMVPGRDLPGSKPGNWRAVFLEEETGNTVTIPFTVAPAE
ncbi:MAG TPA: hypothetical protein VFD32_03185 [Dehalococcoidia bacterium]|nr:hypothetical protein [Dehalococcoidia bacterium]